MFKQAVFAITLLTSLLLSTSSYAVYDMYIEIGNGTNRDYASGSIAEAALDDVGALSSANCGAYTNGTGGDIPDLTTVTWNGGSDSGTLIHMTSTVTQSYMIDNDATGAIEDGDTITDGSGSFDVSGNADSCNLVFRLYDDDAPYDGANVDGWTFGSYVNYLRVVSDETERASWGTAAQDRWPILTDTPWTNRENSMEFSYFRVYFNGTGNTLFGRFNDILVHNMVIGSDGNSNCVVSRGAAGAGIYNNFLIGCGNSNENGLTCDTGGGDCIYLNNSCYNVDDCYVSSSNVIAYNNVCDPLGGGSCFLGDFVEGGYNTSGDGTADDDADFIGNANTNHDFSDDWVDATAGQIDLHLQSGSDLIDDCYFNAIDGTVNIDIDDDTRDGSGDTTDCGADEVVAAGGGGGGAGSQIIIFSGLRNKAQCWIQHMISQEGKRF